MSIADAAKFLFTFGRAVAIISNFGSPVIYNSERKKWFLGGETMYTIFLFFS